MEKLATLVNGGADTTNVTFVLTEDIDLSGYDNWTPIGTYYTAGNSFLGTFDGNGHKITNIKINRTNSSYQALFGGAYQGAIIKNIGIENANIIANSSVGGLVGAGTCVIENCYITGKIVGQNNVGGLIGFIGFIWGSTSTINNSYNSANIIGLEGQGRNYIGGLVGSLNYTQISNSYSLGDVYAPATMHVGGLIGKFHYGTNIQNCYSVGDVTGKSSVGGLIGAAIYSENTSSLCNCISLGTVQGQERVGSFLGHWANTSNGASSATLNISNCSVAKSNLNVIDGAHSYVSSSGQYTYTEIPDYDLSSLLANIQEITIPSTKTSLQVGINALNSSQIDLELSFHLESVKSLSSIGLDDFNYMEQVDDLLKVVSAKQTELGAVQNRLESALDEISTQYENLVSSRSTLRDADISEVSSEYIRQQILQEASATLMSTANQNPMIALQLL